MLYQDADRISHRLSSNQSSFSLSSAFDYDALSRSICQRQDSLSLVLGCDHELLCRELSLDRESLSKDEELVRFLNRRLSRSFGLSGLAEDCPELEERMREAHERDPEAFEEYLLYLYRKCRRRKPKGVKIEVEAVA